MDAPSDAELEPLNAAVSVQLVRISDDKCLHLHVGDASAAPKGTVKTQRMLQQGAFGLSDGGITKTFTPMYLMVGRVPLNKKVCTRFVAEEKKEE